MLTSTKTQVQDYLSSQIFSNLDTVVDDANDAVAFRQGYEAAEQVWAKALPTLRRIGQLPEVRDAIAQYPNSIKAILEFGSEAIELLARRSDAGDAILPWLQRINRTPQGEDVLEIYSRVDNALRANLEGTIQKGLIARVSQENGFDVISFQRPIGPNGSVGEIDVETSNAIIESTISPSGRLGSIIDLLTNTEKNPSSKPVILYAPNYRETPAQDIINAGAYIVRTEQELIYLLTQLQ